MGLKIKCNDDRLRGTTTAILLICRDRLFRGETENLIQTAVREYRADPKGYKENKAVWPDVKELGPLVKPAQVTYYEDLLSAVDDLLKKWTQAKRQFNSLLELDNALVERLPKFDR